MCAFRMPRDLLSPPLSPVPNSEGFSLPHQNPPVEARGMDQSGHHYPAFQPPFSGRSLKRKAGSENLAAVKRETLTRPHVLDTSPLRTDQKWHYQQEFLTHPHYNNNHDFYSIPIDDRSFYATSHLDSSAPSPESSSDQSSSDDDFATLLKAASSSNIDTEPPGAPVIPNTEIVSETRRSRRRGQVASVVSDTSTPSFSRFPKPPQHNESTPPNSSHGKKSSTAPTVYHIRGASFEIFNPRESLSIQNIETPVELDEEARDYFTLQPKESMAPDTAISHHVSPYSRKYDDSAARSTPPRSLFDDLPSAYNSIISRSGRRMQRTSPNLSDVPLPPTPIPTRIPRNSEQAFSAFPDIHSYPADQPRPGYTTTQSASFKKRLSQIFRYGKQDTTTAQDQRRFKLQKTAKSLPLDYTQKSRAASPERPKSSFSSSSEHTGSLHYYDDSSIFGFGSTRQGSDAQFPAVFSTENQASSHTTDVSREPSANDIIASYGDYGSDGSPHSSIRSNRLLRRSTPLLPSRLREAVHNTPDTTIGQILEQYHAQDDSLTMPHSRVPQSPRRLHEPLLTGNAANAAKELRSSQTWANLQLLDDRFVQPLSATQLVRTRSLGRPNHDIRAATAHALREEPSAAPLVSVPATPLTGHGYLTTTSWKYGASVSHTPSAASYEDTRKLLLLPEISTEVGRGVAASSIADEGFDPDVKVPTSPNRHSNTLCVSDVIRRTSSRSLDAIIDRDLHYLSGLSSGSGVTGSVFVVGDENGLELDQERHSVHFLFGEATREPDNSVLTNGESEPCPTFKRASTMPIAAFPRSIVEPGISRLTLGERESLENEKSQHLAHKSNDFSLSSDFVASEDEDQDWETVAAGSRRTLGSRITDGDSFAEWNPFGSLDFHAGNRNYQHSYRLHSPANSNDPVLLPSYAFDGVPAFPYRNTLRPPAPALYTPYKHPNPLSETFENPFTSSPPQITGTSPRSFRFTTPEIDEPSQSEGSHRLVYQYDRPNLSVIQEQTEYGLTSELISNRFGEHTTGFQSASSSIVLTEPDSSIQLGSQPGPEMSTGAERGSPTNWQREQDRPKSNVLNSGADATLLQRLRVDDPRMASSPLSLTNSFNKLSRLGIKANVTGTPNGTGMREVGSSLVGSSSPYAYGSSPPVADQSSPITPESVLRWNPGSMPLVSDPNSPLNQYDKQRYYTPNFERPQYQQNNRHDESVQIQLKPINFAKSHNKRSVSGQRHLMQMTLGSEDKLVQTNTNDGRESRATVSTNRPLLPLTSSSGAPRLHNPYRPPSSNASALRNRKQKISWICFAMCLLLPYLLILYGHGGLDAIMLFISNGQIEHFGRRQKKCAKIVGWSTAGATVLTIAVAWIIIRTLPNNYPR